MTIKDLTNNKERIIKNIKFQITLATQENIKAVMTKMVAMLPQFADSKATMKNIDVLTNKATLSYIKYGHTHNANQANAVDQALEAKRMDSLPSSLR